MTVPNHRHFFSPLCFDEVHGRFDAVIDESGRAFVKDVGTGVETPSGSYQAALGLARSSAAAYRVSVGWLLAVEGLAAEMWTNANPGGPAWRELETDSPEEITTRLEAWTAAAAAGLSPREPSGFVEPDGAP